MSLLQKITDSCSVFCLLGNYLSMCDSCFWLYGCLISLKAVARWTLLSAFGKSKWTVAIWFCFSSWPWFREFQGIMKLRSIKLCLFFPQMLYLFIPQNEFFYSVSICLGGSLSLLVPIFLDFSRNSTSSTRLILMKELHTKTESQKPFILSSIQNSCLKSSSPVICLLCLHLPLLSFTHNSISEQSWHSLKPGLGSRAVCSCSQTDQPQWPWSILAGLTLDVPALPWGAGVMWWNWESSQWAAPFCPRFGPSRLQTLCCIKETCTSLCRYEGASVEPHLMRADAQNKQLSLS